MLPLYFGINYWDEPTEEEVEAIGNLKRLQNKREAHRERLLNIQDEDLLPVWEFEVHDYVWKPKGYPFEGTVVSRFSTLGGDRRYVVESKLSPGMLHIFNEAQLEAV